MNDFQIDIPLPTGSLLVEASAGTGKTWSIARLVARLLLETPVEGGEPPTIDQLLVVTFTKAATAELRDRIRTFLLAAARALVEAGGVERPADAGLACLIGRAGGGAWERLPSEALELRLVRVNRALRDFDLAEISTIHGFCQRVLSRLAFESGASLDTELITDPGELVAEVVDDWLHRILVPASDALCGWLSWSKGGGLDRQRMLEIARRRIAARGNPVLPSAPYEWRTELARRAHQAAGLAARVAGQEGDSLVAAIEGAVAEKRLSGSQYRANSVPARRRELLHWLREGALPIPGEPWADPLKRFCGSWIEENALNKGKTRPQHPLLDACDAFARTLGAPVRDGILEEFATYAACEFDRRMRRLHQQSFDDLLELVRAGLVAGRPGRGALIAGLRSQFRAALIDEFQDTDATQWEIFRTVFAEDPRGRLILIGDPKQAIYAFRGADVSVYAMARDTVAVGRRYTMTTNFRSDGPLLAAIEQVIGGSPNLFLRDGIAFIPVRAHHGAARLQGSGGEAVDPLVIRWFDGTFWDTSADPGLSNSAAEGLLPALVASDVARELSAGSLREQINPVRARDIAVLTYSNAAASAVHAQLIAAGVPAVISTAGSVFQTAEAGWIGWWLSALSDANERAARRFAVSPLCGWTLADVFRARLSLGTPDPRAAEWPRFVARLRHQAELVDSQRFTEAIADLLCEPCEPEAVSPLARIAAFPDGERRLTNLRHLAELLHGAALAKRLGCLGLNRWFSDCRAEVVEEDEVAQLRLESEADTVSVVTMHKSKGLEYPIVYLPYLWDGRLLRGKNLEHQPIRFHRPGAHVVTTDLRGRAGAHAADSAAALQEAQEERQRLLYVALTRAMHRAVLYHGPITGKSGFHLGASPLGLCFHHAASGAPSGAELSARTAERVGALLKEDPLALRAEVSARAGRGLVVEAVDVQPARYRWIEAAASGQVKVPPPFSRLGFDRSWRRCSYSALVGDRHATVGAESPLLPLPPARDRDLGDIEEESGPLSEGGAVSGPAVPALPLAGFPGGPEAGSWVHEVFERLSFTTGAPKSTDTPLATLIRERGARNGFAKAEKDMHLQAAIPAILATPLGPAVGHATLAELPDALRLDELGFDLSIGGEHPIASRSLAAVLGTQREETMLPDGYFEQVRKMWFRPLAGYLIGFIDLVFRVPVAGRNRWFVADYKTNILGERRGGAGPVVRTGPEFYGQAAMAREIAKKHYYIQYLLYLVALHRYLELRVPDYDYDEDMGGAAYLFVRGMCGSETSRDALGRVNGVFVDKPPRALIMSLSERFALGGEA